MKSVFVVTLVNVNQRTGVALWINFECGYGSIAELTAALNDGDLVAGEALYTSRLPDEPDAVEVMSRRPYALGRRGIASIELPRVRFVEYGDADPA